MNVLDAIQKRRAVRSFSDQPVPADVVETILRAGSRAQSSKNSQPWRFIVGRKGQGESWQKLFDCLGAGNQAWCVRVPVLMLSVAVPTFRHNGSPNRHGQHDTGMASAQMAIQATSMGLAIHFMAGFDRDKARTTLAIPEGYEPMAMIALGRQAPADVLPEETRARELAPRQRLPLEEIAFDGAWGRSLTLG